jgi:hypothetical protein
MSHGSNSRDQGVRAACRGYLLQTWTETADPVQVMTVVDVQLDQDIIVRFDQVHHAIVSIIKTQCSNFEGAFNEWGERINTEFQTARQP